MTLSKILFKVIQIQMFAWISLGVVLVSTFTFVLGTFPEFQKEEDTGQPPPYPEAVLVMEVVGNLDSFFCVVLKEQAFEEDLGKPSTWWRSELVSKAQKITML